MSTLEDGRKGIQKWNRPRYFRNYFSHCIRGGNTDFKYQPTELQIYQNTMKVNKIYKPFSLWINSSFSRSQSSFEWINFIHVPGKFLTKNLLNFRTGCWNPASFVHFRTYFSQIVLYISLLHFKVQGRILFILKI